MQFINQTSAQVLLDRRDAAADANIFSICAVPRLSKSGFDAVCDEMERRATVHDDWRTPVMGEYKHRHVIRRVFTPPAFPIVIRPRAPNGPNMFRPIIQAPTFSKLRVANWSSTPASPPSWPNIVRKVRVLNAHSCRAIPFTPSGFSALCLGPAPKPSSDSENARTLTTCGLHIGPDWQTGAPPHTRPAAPWSAPDRCRRRTP